MGHISRGWVVEAFDVIASRRELSEEEAGYAEITILLAGGHTIRDVERVTRGAEVAALVVETTTSTVYVSEQNVVAIETP